VRDLDELFTGLARSKFRQSFYLKGRDLAYLREKGLPTVLEHAQDFIARRLAPAVIPNDGKQTPYRGHPVFVAQHATACCCRGCLEKWHRIPAGRPLEPEEAAYILEVLGRWLTQAIEYNQSLK
jgi:preprotein translocase subunit Sec63